MAVASRIGFTYEDELRKGSRTRLLQEASMNEITRHNLYLWDGRNPKELK